MTAVIAPEPFLVLQSAGMTWDFADLAGGGNVHVQCEHPEGGRIRLAVKRGDESSHLLFAPNAENGQTQYTLLESAAGGNSFTWKDGLVLPAAWPIGESVTTTSNETNPATGNRVNLIARLEALEQFQLPDVFPKPGATAERIRIRQRLFDDGLGMNLADIMMFFCFGVGIYRVEANVFGVTSVLELQNWSGWG